jgi:hypothetical protein
MEERRKEIKCARRKNETRNLTTVINDGKVRN